MKTTAKMKMGTKSIGSVAVAAVALAFGAILFAAPEADARPPKETEDRITTAKADCAKKPDEYVGGTWSVVERIAPRPPSYKCHWQTLVGGDRTYWTQHFNSQGMPGQICWRIDIESPWTCV